MEGIYRVANVLERIEIQLRRIAIALEQKNLEGATNIAEPKISDEGYPILNKDQLDSFSFSTAWSTVGFPVNLSTVPGIYDPPYENSIYQNDFPIHRKVKLFNNACEEEGECK